MHEGPPGRACAAPDRRAHPSPTGVPVSPKNLVLTAGVALVVVLAHQSYAQGKLPKLGR